uniref:Uncharacterized protein n=1 Tax=Chromera velia CCMP2878 TaxID=1169474 RepID=A0A0G4GW10_9ALVE|eukprot:Cvel_23641.t1-p1 / transcript=Cvel_23641.t1 / gene=Cvel_23641 / organism=Chromera_velia_CCMP2878 / gene_product=hypothetical protein / transcript_product=hypothetical protein / location=Cvel_scaffold2459:9986-26284(+) / protein_length=1106 / sequence_SO=supercontig / SO=protein_coding / is_pseudo=false
MSEELRGGPVGQQRALVPFLLRPPKRTVSLPVVLLFQPLTSQTSSESLLAEERDSAERRLSSALEKARSLHVDLSRLREGGEAGDFPFSPPLEGNEGGFFEDKDGSGKETSGGEPEKLRGGLSNEGGENGMDSPPPLPPFASSQSRPSAFLEGGLRDLDGNPSLGLRDPGLQRAVEAQQVAMLQNGRMQTRALAGRRETRGGFLGDPLEGGEGQRGVGEESPFSQARGGSPGPLAGRSGRGGRDLGEDGPLNEDEAALFSALEDSPSASPSADLLKDQMLEREVQKAKRAERDAFERYQGRSRPPLPQALLETQPPNPFRNPSRQVSTKTQTETQNQTHQPDGPRPSASSLSPTAQDTTIPARGGPLPVPSAFWQNPNLPNPSRTQTIPHTPNPVSSQQRFPANAAPGPTMTFLQVEHSPEGLQKENGMSAGVSPSDPIRSMQSPSSVHTGSDQSLIEVQQQEDEGEEKEAATPSEPTTSPSAESQSPSSSEDLPDTTNVTTLSTKVQIGTEGQDTAAVSPATPFLGLLQENSHSLSPLSPSSSFPVPWKRRRRTKNRRKTKPAGNPFSPPGHHRREERNSITPISSLQERGNGGGGGKGGRRDLSAHPTLKGPGAGDSEKWLGLDPTLTKYGYSLDDNLKVNITVRDATRYDVDDEGKWKMLAGSGVSAVDKKRGPPPASGAPGGPPGGFAQVVATGLNKTAAARTSGQNSTDFFQKGEVHRGRGGKGGRRRWKHSAGGQADPADVAAFFRDLRETERKLKKQRGHGSLFHGSGSSIAFKRGQHTKGVGESRRSFSHREEGKEEGNESRGKVGRLEEDSEGEGRAKVSGSVHRNSGWSSPLSSLSSVCASLWRAASTPFSFLSGAFGTSESTGGERSKAPPPETSQAPLFLPQMALHPSDIDTEDAETTESKGKSEHSHVNKGVSSVLQGPDGLTEREGREPIGGHLRDSDREGLLRRRRARMNMRRRALYERAKARRGRIETRHSVLSPSLIFEKSSESQDSRHDLLHKSRDKSHYEKSNNHEHGKRGNETDRDRQAAGPSSSFLGLRNGNSGVTPAARLVPEQFASSNVAENPETSINSASGNLHVPDFDNPSVDRQSVFGEE